MSLANEILEKVESFKEGQVFSFNDFRHFENPNVVALTLSRLCKDKVISRVSKGLYFKPGSSVTAPTQEEILSSILKGAQPSGAVALGLTETPEEFIIMGHKYNRQTEISGIKVRYRRQIKNLKTRHKELLYILDALKDIKKIPGSKPEEVFIKLRDLVIALSLKKRLNLVSLALQHKPVVRVLLGIMLESIDPEASIALKKTLLPKTKFYIGLPQELIPNAKAWGIL